jgi:hypothetical protein
MCRHHGPSIGVALVAARIKPRKIAATELQHAIFKRSILQGREDAFFDPTGDGAF